MTTSSTNRPAGRVHSSGIAVWLAIVACSGLLACTPVEQASPEPTTILESPAGAIPPKGISGIEKGMSQDEVLRILTPLYAVQHAADAEPSSPIVDYFTYVEGGKTKYVEIFYDGNTVHSVRFGYTDHLVIE